MFNVEISGSTEWPQNRQELGTCFEGRVSFGGDQFSSRKLFGFSEGHWQSPWSQVAHERPPPESCGRMFHANHHVPGERATYKSTAGHSEEGRHSRAEKEGRLLITKPPLIESSPRDWLMNPRPPRTTLSTDLHWSLLSGHPALWGVAGWENFTKREFIMSLCNILRGLCQLECCVGTLALQGPQKTDL